MKAFFLLLPLFLIFVSCAPLSEEGRERATYTPVSFSELDGWSDDSFQKALEGFRLSCARTKSKPEWRDVCASAQKDFEGNDAIRAFFEEEFTPYAITSDGKDAGLFTGYYVPEVKGSLKRQGKFQTPLYARPKDLVSVDLGNFRKSLKGQKIVGKVRNNALVPYDTRANIAKGALRSRAKPLVWLEDPVDAFFLEIQGSGRVKLTKNRTLSIGYDSANGRDYTSIGRVLADRGDLARPVTMPILREHLALLPLSAQQIMNLNESYVFFRWLPTQGVLGAQGVELTPERSLAIDPRFLPLGAPVWLDTVDGKGHAFKRLMIAQDTGGAIKGPVRGDVFWGEGKDAETQAGLMQSRGRVFVLLPKTVEIYGN